MEQTVFITKYCLSSSIFKVEAKIGDAAFTKRNIFAVANIPGQGTMSYFNDDFHLSEEEALADFEKRKAKKIESLKKQMVKLEKKQPKIV